MTRPIQTTAPRQRRPIPPLRRPPHATTPSSPPRVLQALPAMALSALLLAGCAAVGPNYAGPPVVAKAATDRPAFERSRVSPVNDAPPPSRWWEAIGDPILTRLVDDAFAASPILQSAEARVRSARAQQAVNRAALGPTGGAGGRYVRGRVPTGSLLGSSSGSGSGSSSGGSGSSSSIPNPIRLNSYTVDADATWEIDLFGGKRRGLESATAAAESSQAALEDAQVRLAGDVGQAYAQLREAQDRLALASRTVELRSRMLSLTLQRQAGGTASQGDVARADADLAQARAELPGIATTVDQQLDQLAILAGREPGAYDALLAVPAASWVEPPLPPDTVPVGTPADWLRRRPDIRQAERMLASRNATIGQNVADLFPERQHPRPDRGHRHARQRVVPHGADLAGDAIADVEFPRHPEHAGEDPRCRGRPRREHRRLPAHRARGAPGRQRFALEIRSGPRGLARTRSIARRRGPGRVDHARALRRRHRQLRRCARCGAPAHAGRRCLGAGGSDLSHRLRLAAEEPGPRLGSVACERRDGHGAGQWRPAGRSGGVDHRDVSRRIADGRGDVVTRCRPPAGGAPRQQGQRRRQPRQCRDDRQRPVRVRHRRVGIGSSAWPGRTGWRAWGLGTSSGRWSGNRRRRWRQWRRQRHGLRHGQQCHGERRHPRGRQQRYQHRGRWWRWKRERQLRWKNRFEQRQRHERRWRKQRWKQLCGTTGGGTGGTGSGGSSGSGGSGGSGGSSGSGGNSGSGGSSGGSGSGGSGGSGGGGSGGSGSGSS